MSEFLPAVEKLLVLEDGFVDDLRDEGGATNWGLSLRFLKTLNSNWSVEGVKSITRKEAIALYEEHFWQPSNIIQVHDQSLANKLFDIAVNMGIWTAIVLLQQAIGMKTVDGVLGPETAAVTNLLPPSDTLRFVQLEAVRYYHHLATVNPSQRGFLRGWIGRALA